MGGGENECAVVKIVFDRDSHKYPLDFVPVYSNLPTVELFYQGTSHGKQSMAWSNWTQWNIPYGPGNVTAVGYDANGKAVASDTVITSKHIVSKAVLTLDVPSVATGTGTSLYADGHDAAMLRVTLTDEDGILVNNAKDTVTFKIVSGPGRIIGVGNGDPASHEPNKSNKKSAYHGLVRCFVQVTANVVDVHRVLQIDQQIPGQSTNHYNATLLDDIVVEATTSAGLVSNQVRIPVSTLVKDSVMRTAAAFAQADLVIS